MKWIIFDLDGTLADIEDRRRLCTKENGKMDWNKFFDPENYSDLKNGFGFNTFSDPDKISFCSKTVLGANLLFG